MKKLNIVLMALALTLSISCKDKNKEDENMDESMTEMDDSESMESDNMDMKEITVPMASKSGSSVTGSISFTQKGDEVEMKVNLKGLDAGTHAIHLHENGDCSTDDAKSAGGHWNPKTNEHGDWDDGMHHMGDIGNLEADADGNASLTFNTDKWCIECKDDANNIVGKAIIVHALADDFKTQPSGAAGDRVACGVIK